MSASKFPYQLEGETKKPSRDEVELEKVTAASMKCSWTRIRRFILSGSTISSFFPLDVLLDGSANRILVKLCNTPIFQKSSAHVCIMHDHSSRSMFQIYTARDGHRLKLAITLDPFYLNTWAIRSTASFSNGVPWSWSGQIKVT